MGAGGVTQYTVRRDKGCILVEGLPIALATHLRRKMERAFEVTATLTIEIEDVTTITLGGTGHRELGVEETPNLYRMWLRGWFAGREDWDLKPGGPL